MLNALPPTNVFDATSSLHGNSRNHPHAPNSRHDSTSTIEHYNRLVDRLSAKVLQLQQQPGDHHQYMVAIAGGPGSGKTTSALAVAQRLNARFPHEPNVAVVIPMDGFHYSRDDLTARYGPEALLRRGAPWTFDAPAILQTLQSLKSKHCGILPTYSRELSNPVLDGVHVEHHHKILLVEGLYLLHTRDPDWAPLQALWDERWFVQAPTRDLQKERLLKRSLQNWSWAKAQQWGAGAEGAQRLLESNDVKNMDLLDYCADLADEVIVTN